MRFLLAALALAAVAACGQRSPEPRELPATQVMGGPAMRDPEALREQADTHIVTQIKRELSADRELGAFVIDVDAKDGLVVLSGVAPNGDARERATEIARHQPNVRGIANQLTVRQG